MALRKDGPAAEDGPEVEHIVLDPPFSVGRLQHVQTIDAARVVVIEPGGKNARCSKLATMLVQHEIVRVVGPPAVVPEVAERLSGGEATDEHAITPVL